MEDVLWSEFPRYLCKANYMSLPVPGSGFCYFNALELALMIRYEYSCSIEQIKQITYSYIRANETNLRPYHNGKIVPETLQFYKDGIFNKAVVDLLVSITPHALRTNVYIYQKRRDGMVQVLPIVNPAFNREVHLKFTRDDLSSEGNHYEPLVPSCSDFSPEVEFPQEKCEFEEVSSRTSDLLAPPTYDDVINNYQQYQEDSTSLDTSSSSTTPSVEIIDLVQGEEDTAVLLSHKFPVHLFKGVPEEWVEYIPGDINGKHVYKVKCTHKEWHYAQVDQRYFKMKSSKWKDIPDSKVKVGYCAGSLFCPNEECPFTKTAPEINETQFRRLDASKACFSCGVYAEGSTCGARKMTAYNYRTQVLTVWHIGRHLCKPKLDSKLHIEKVRAAVKRNRHVGPVQMKLIEVGDATDKGDIAEGKRRARQLNWKRLRMENGLIAREQNPNPQSMEAVGLYKEAVDEHDEYLIWLIHDKRYDTQKPDMVIKSSKEMVKLMDKMNQDGPSNPMQEMEVFFDGAHRRVTGFISLALWTTHPAMLHVMRLCSMEVRWERTDDITHFWKSGINAMLSHYKGKPTKFNPKCIMVDENGANFNGIEAAFDLDYRMTKVVSCQKHYQANVLIHARTLPYSYRDGFIKTCYKMCSCTTVAEYNDLKAVLDKYVSLFPQLGPFVQWWDVRKYHVFPPFRRYGYTRSNLAEVGNSMMKRRNQLYLLEAAKDDTKAMTVQVEDFLSFLNQESSSSGTAPNQVARAADARREQMRMAKAFAEEFRNPDAVAAERAEDEACSAFRPVSSCKHRPGSRKGVEGTVINPVTGRKQKAPKKKQGKKTVVAPGVLERSMDMAREVMQEVEADDDAVSSSPLADEDNNPRIELYMDRAITRCQGCPLPIRREDLTPPKDLIIRTKGLRIWFDKAWQQRRSSFGKLYFHLKMECLQGKYGNRYQKEDLKVEDDTLQMLTRDHMRYLKKIGFLEVILSGRNTAGNN